LLITFQFTVTFHNTSNDVGYFLIVDIAPDFMGISRPIISNEGPNSYWSVSCSGYSAWVREDGLDSYKFNRFPSAIKGFSRSLNYPGQPCFAAHALSSNPTEHAHFSGSADTEFVCLSFDFSVKRP
jgi:hypothetical protein